MSIFLGHGNLRKRAHVGETLDDHHHCSSSSPQAVKGSIGGMLAMAATAKPLRAPGQAVFLPTFRQGLHGGTPVRKVWGSLPRARQRTVAPSLPIKGFV
uniref:Uncharacterized protein n=1 Tax=Solanum tuberosum TaxID=4113 RepID=M1DUP3_SOLTU